MGLRAGSVMRYRNRRALAESFAAAEATFDLAAKVREASAALDAFVPGYRPLHREVRAIQASIRRLDREADELATDLRRLPRGAGADERRRLEREIAGIQDDKRRLEAQLPADWAERRKRYLALAGAERRARLAYRRNVDGAYEPIVALRGIVAQADALAALGDRLAGLPATVADGAPVDRAVSELRAAERAFNRVDGAGHVKSRFSRARRALTRNAPNRAKAAAEIAEGLARHAAEVAWRRAAQATLAAGLEAYDLAIRDTIGLRLQDRLPGDRAGDIAGCLAVHRDVSLSF